MKLWHDILVQYWTWQYGYHLSPRCKVIPLFSTNPGILSKCHTVRNFPFGKISTWLFLLFQEKVSKYRTFSDFFREMILYMTILKSLIFLFLHRHSRNIIWWKHKCVMKTLKKRVENDDDEPEIPKIRKWKWVWLIAEPIIVWQRAVSFSLEILLNLNQFN